MSSRWKGFEIVNLMLSHTSLRRSKQTHADNEKFSEC